MVPVGLLAIGERAEVKVVGQAVNQERSCSNGKDEADTCSQLENMGLRAGQTVEMLNNDGRGPILLKVDNSRIAIDRSMAMKIKVSMQEAK